jgi:exosortase
MDFVSTTDPGRPAGADSVAGQIAPVASDPPRSPQLSIDARQDVQLYGGLTAATWTKIGIITALMSALFWPNLHRLWLKTNPFTGEANWGHAICVPIIGLYYLYVNREKLLHPPELRTFSPLAHAMALWGLIAFAVVSPLFYVKLLASEYFNYAAILAGVIVVAAFVYCWMRSESPLIENALQSSSQWFGGYIVVFGVAFYGYWIYPGQNDFFKDFGMVITLFGVVLALTDWKVMQTAWFPIAFLVCGIPWPGLIYSRIALPLQQLAANVAVWTLQITGVESSSNGTKIFISGYNGVVRTLNVAEACAGLRSLMTFVSVGAAVAFLSHRPLWQKITITLSAIPIAIFCNVMRISGQGLLDHYVSQQLSENFAHQFVGMIMLIPAFLLILLIGWVLDQIFLEEVDRKRIAVTKVIRRNTAGPVIALPATPRPGRVSTTGAANSRKPAQISAAPVARSLAAVKAAAANNSPGVAGAMTPPPSMRLASGRPQSAGSDTNQNRASQNVPSQNVPPQNLPSQNLPPQNLPPQNLPSRNLPRPSAPSQSGGVPKSGPAKTASAQKVSPIPQRPAAPQAAAPQPAAPGSPASKPTSRPEVP